MGTLLPPDQATNPGHAIGLDVVTLAVGARRERESGIKTRAMLPGAAAGAWRDLQAGFILSSPL